MPEAFTRYSQGAAIKQLVDWLNEQGVFTFNYKEGTKAITIADIDGSDLCVSGAPRFYREKSIAVAVDFLTFIW